MKPTWKIGLSNEIGKLSQGVGDRVSGTDTIDFIHKVKSLQTKRLLMQILYLIIDH